MKNEINISTLLGLLLGVVAIFGSFVLEGGQVNALVVISPICTIAP